MARKRKNRTHLRDPNFKDKDGVASSTLGTTPGRATGAPKSFVIKHGPVGHSLSQLVRDVRKMMEPNTASRLRERARNKLKDFLTMAPALHVTHLLAFTLTDVAPSLRIVRLPAGPTLSFRLERYSLVKDLLATTKHGKSIGLEYLSPPLLVLSSFPPPGPNTPSHLPLVQKSFQSLFPPLSPQTLSLSSARRVVLVSYNSTRETIDVRHYRIAVRATGVSRRVRRALTPGSTSAFLDLGREKDVADYVLRKRGEGDGYESAVSDASSAAGEDGDATVSLPGDYVGRNNKKGTKRAVRLDEIGPRMELRLVKIVEGPPGKDGAVMYHHFVKKTKAETKAQEKEHREKEKLRKARREEQERNIERKKAANQQGKNKEGDEEDEDEDEDEEADEEDEDEWDDEAEVSDGEVDNETDGSESEAESEPENPPPPKKRKLKGKR